MSLPPSCNRSFAGGRPAPRSALAGASLLAALAVGLLGPAGCGLKTPPQPAAEVLPPTSGVRAWQRESRVIVSWSPPGAARVREFGTVEGYALTVQARPVVCVGCALPEPLELRVSVDAPELLRLGGRLFYPLDVRAGEERLTIFVRTLHGSGTSPAGAGVVVERGRDIPAAALGWRWAGAEPQATGGTGNTAQGSARARSVQFFWDAPRERSVHLIDSAGGPREEVRRFRANIYRRIPPQDFPPTPLNGKPLNGTSWIVPPLQVDLPADAPGESYQLRLVDQFGNEGAASPEVLVPRGVDASDADGTPARERAS